LTIIVTLFDARTDEPTDLNLQDTSEQRARRRVTHSGSATGHPIRVPDFWRPDDFPLGVPPGDLRA
jgi:hypothetical protein